MPNEFRSHFHIPLSPVVMDLHSSGRDYYRGRKVYVSGDLLVYYVQGDNGERLLTRQKRLEHEAAARRIEAERAGREAAARWREAEARQAAGAELARLRDELERLRNRSS